MGTIQAEVSDELENAFRSAVADRIGFKKGNLQIAIEQALRLWIKTKEK
jgi:hypothetical protein